jgi:four helix bundle protein
MITMLEKYQTEIENNIYDLSKEFAIRIVKLYNYLRDNKQERVMSKQLLRSGTSIGANVFEGKNAQSRPDFTTKMNIALKEATESGYWIDLLHDTNYLSDSEFESIFADCKRIIAVLTKIVKTTKPQKS